MKTLLNILKKAGGWRPGLHIRIENRPYLRYVLATCQMDLKVEQ